MIPSPQRARRRAAPAPLRRPRSAALSSGTVIPYDHAAIFELRRQPGNLVQDVINISPERVFVALAFGYKFEEERGRPIDTTIGNDGRWFLRLSRSGEQSRRNHFRENEPFISIGG